MFQPCLRAVERTVRRAAKFSALETARKQPEIFWRSFIMRASRSA